MNITQAGRSVRLFVLTSLLLFNFNGYTQQRQLQSETIKVWGLCGMCKSRIETSLREWGINEARWNSNTLELSVLYDTGKFSSADIQNRLAALGHATETIDADQTAYKALPECCQYTRASSSPVEISLNPTSSAELDQVVIHAKKFSAYVSSLSTLNTLQMGTAELNKAACCNLSESFETNPSVDVSYADGITGVKQILLLGLSGSYTQMLREQLPAMRGLSGSYGLTFIPGPWIESIQLTKGIGSVLNGYESIAGQINIEEKKTDTAQKLYVNAYGNDFGRLEGSFIMNQQVTKSWSTAMLSHFNGVFNKMDRNHDGFLDMPLGQQVNLQNRWKYALNAWNGQIMLKFLSDDRQAGQLDFNSSISKLNAKRYVVSSQIKQYEISGKLGYIFPEHKFSSLGFAFSLSNYSDQSFYGLKTYAGEQQSVYAKIIYQSIISTNKHQFSTGLSFAGDSYDESFVGQQFKRYEIVPGAFWEYTYGAGAFFTIIMGARADYHNQYRWLLTPRLALKYDLSPQTTLRFSGGSGWRTANILAENRSFMFSARQFEVSGGNIKYAYGLHPEKAWNYGFNLTQRLQVNRRLMLLTFDLYRTTFNKQAVIDIDADRSKVFFYDLQGQSFSNSMQTALNYELFNHFDLRLAYRWLDVQTDYSGKLLAKPLLAKHRAFINLAYQAPRHWSFDYTLQWFGEKRLPGEMSTTYAPAYTQMMAQISKRFRNNLELYLGGENLTNYQQPQAIIAADEPFSARFDGAQIWGPINGRMFYFGLRFQIK